MDVVVERERAFPMGASINPTAIPPLLVVKSTVNVPFEFLDKSSVLEWRPGIGFPV